MYCKLSGLVTEADHANWQKEDLKPYVDHVINCFGADRVIFGSDWPVSLLCIDAYPQWVQFASEFVQNRPVDEQRKIFRDNAIKVYL